MAFSREELEAYEKRPQTKVDDKVNPFRGATPAKAADAAAVAAVAAGQVDATPGGAPAQAVAAPDPLVDDAPVVDEGQLGDPTDSGEGTSDETSASSTETVDPSDESAPNADLVETPTEEVEAEPAPKKGSAAERIVEVLDLMEGYKIYGKAKDEQVKELQVELERLRAQTTAAAPAPAPVVEEKDEPMPTMGDKDVNYDDDLYREKMTKWVKTQGRIEARRELRAAAASQAQQSVNASVEAKVAAFEKDHPDFATKVRNNVVLRSHQLHPFAGRLVSKSEYTADLLYAFGSDTAMAVRVAQMDPEDQISAINDMITKIKAEKAEKKATVKTTPTQAGAKPAAKSITKAPPPPRATPAAGRPASRDVQDPAMGMDEFARQHRANKESARTQNRKLRGLN
jgi:hypothetical protein